MPNPTVPDFTELGARKLADLLEKGFVITGYCFERQVDGTQPQRGFVDFAGFVGWWQADMQREVFAKPQLAGETCRLCGCTYGHEVSCRMLRPAHGVADMKGEQDGPASQPVQSQA